MSTPLPEEIEFGYVAGRYLLAVKDTTDDPDAESDGQPAAGAITFAPVSEKIISSSPVPTLVTKTSKTFSLDAEGYLSDDHGNRAVGLVTGVYTVTYGLKGVRNSSFQIQVTSGHTPQSPLWLPTAAPYVPPTGVTAQVVQVLGSPVPGSFLGVTDAGQVAYVPGGSEFELRGTGMPNGVVTAAPGTYYTDTAGTNGAWRWLKKSGTGKTGWVCVEGDTGPRNVTALSPALDVEWSTIIIRRVGPFVSLAYEGEMKSGGSWWRVLGAIPGFRPNANTDSPIRTGANDYKDGLAASVSTGSVLLSFYAKVNSLPPGTWLSGNFLYLTSEPFPTNLPGVPA